MHMYTYTHMYTHIYMKARGTTFRCLKGKKKGVSLKKKKSTSFLEGGTYLREYVG